MSDTETPKNWLSSAGVSAVGLGFFILLLEMILGTDSGLGAGCCCFGVFGVVAGSIVSSAGAAVSSDGKMVLKQDTTGQWNWVANSGMEIPQPVNTASNYNDQDTQIMSRVITEVRNGKSLEQLDSNELGIVASAYGIDSGSDKQKIEALHNSDLAKMAMKLGAVGVAGGAGAVGAAHIIKSGRERAAQRAEELREQGREKLQENIDAGKYKINSKLPKAESGEEATDVAHNIVLDQLRKLIQEKDLTPEKMLELGDINKDGKLDPQEIATALTVATGFSVPVFVVSDAMKDFDLNADGTLNYSELNELWNKLGLGDNQEQQVDDEIDAVLEEIEDKGEESLDESEQIAIEEGQQETVAEEVSETSIEEEIEEIPIEEEIIPVEVDESVLTDELTEGIDTEFERFVLEMEGARFSSERKTLMEKHGNDFMINMRIQKMERTLIGDPKYRSGQSVHALIDGGPYVGVVKIPVELDEIILQHKEGDEIKVMARLVDFSPSLKRPVLEASKFV